MSTNFFALRNPTGDLYTFAAQLSAAEAAENEAWLREALRPHIPPAIFSAIERKVNLPFVSRWILSHGFQVEVHPRKTRLMRDGNVLAERPVGWSNVVERWSKEPRGEVAIISMPSPDDLAKVFAAPPKEPLYMYDLWTHLNHEHGLTLLESELNDIVLIARKYPVYECYWSRRALAAEKRIAELEARRERCVACNKLTADWVDTEQSGGRVCRDCETKQNETNHHDPQS